MLARGAADDKGQIHAHVMSAAAVLATRGGFPVNLKYVFEGEEESSSAHLDAWLDANRDLVAADVAIISDTGFFTGNVPAITVGLRGIMYAQIDVVGTAVDLHSGGYRRGRPEPGQRPGPDHRGAQGSGRPDPDPGLLRRRRRRCRTRTAAAIAALPFDEAAYQETLGLSALVGEVGFTTLERRGARPTLDVNGIWGGFQGEGSKTIIPAHAHAKVSCRLVADQDPNRIFEAFRDFVAEIAPPGVTVIDDPARCRRGEPHADRPSGDTGRSPGASRRRSGSAPVFIREGGSIPVCASFTSTLGLPVVLFGFTQSEDNAHAPNEWMDLDNYESGIRAIARLWDELADLPH